MQAEFHRPSTTSFSAVQANNQQVIGGIAGLIERGAMANRRVMISSSRAGKRKYGAVRESAHSQTDGQSSTDSGEDGFDPVPGDGALFRAADTMRLVRSME